LSQLILRVFIDGNQLSSVKLGERVKVLYDGPEEIQETEGTVSWISSEAEFTPKIIQTREDRVNLVYAVKVQVPNDGSLKIGMPGEIKLIQN
jgi:HlyD family secretion protein